VVLVHRGCKIDLLWTPRYEHDNADQLENAVNMYQKFLPPFSKIEDDRFRPISVHDVPMKTLSSELTGEIEKQAIRDTVHTTQDVRIDIEGRHRNIYRHHLHVLQQFAGVLETMFEENKYDTVLIPNGVLFECGITRRVGLHHNVPVCSLDSFRGVNEFQICSSWTQPALDWDTAIVEDAWKADEPHISTPEVKANVQKMWSISDNPDDNIYSQQFVKSDQIDSIRSLLCLDDAKPIVLILPSLGHEKHFRVKHYGFRDHVEWFEEIVEHLTTRDDCTVVIRSHPYPINAKTDPLNIGASNEHAEPILDRMFEKLPPHFRLVKAKDDVNTYDLLSMADIILTYHSTMALEAAIIGKPSVLCSNIHYAEKGFTYDANTKDAYINTIDELICNPAKGRLTERQIELAECYANVWYFKWPKPFPWNIQRPNFRYYDYPLERVLSLEMILSPFMESFDQLVSPERPSDTTRSKEVELYIETAREHQSKGDIELCQRLLGHLELVNLSDLKIRWPITFNTLMENWQWAMETISSTNTTDSRSSTLDTIVDPNQLVELVVHGFNDFNIIRMDSEFHAILQSDGAFEPSKLLTDRYTRYFVGQSISEVKSLILEDVNAT
jgi:hypothetical protein